MTWVSSEKRCAYLVWVTQGGGGEEDGEEEEEKEE